MNLKSLEKLRNIRFLKKRVMCCLALTLWENWFFPLFSGHRQEYAQTLDHPHQGTRLFNVLKRHLPWIAARISTTDLILMCRNGWKLSSPQSLGWNNLCYDVSHWYFVVVLLRFCLKEKSFKEFWVITRPRYTQQF